MDAKWAVYQSARRYCGLPVRTRCELQRNFLAACLGKVHRVSECTSESIKQLANCESPRRMNAQNSYNSAVFADSSSFRILTLKATQRGRESWSQSRVRAVMQQLITYHFPDFLTFKGAHATIWMGRSIFVKILVSPVQIYFTLIATSKASSNNECILQARSLSLVTLKNKRANNSVSQAHELRTHVQQ